MSKWVGPTGSNSCLWYFIFFILGASWSALLPRNLTQTFLYAHNTWAMEMNEGQLIKELWHHFKTHGFRHVRGAKQHPTQNQCHKSLHYKIILILRMSNTSTLTLVLIRIIYQYFYFNSYIICIWNSKKTYFDALQFPFTWTENHLWQYHYNHSR
jgi:hypothetical protein